ncbi:MAG: PilZ domain-containing protein [Thermodesulfobacteriota bacterium]
MENDEHRRYPRHETEMRVTIHKNGEEIPATLIDISEGGIGLISEQEFSAGTKVDITINYIDDYAVHGTVRWSCQIQDGSQIYYRFGVQADSVLIMEDIMEGGFPERSGFVKKLLS